MKKVIVTVGLRIVSIFTYGITILYPQNNILEMNFQQCHIVMLSKLTHYLTHVSILHTIYFTFSVQFLKSTADCYTEILLYCQEKLEGILQKQKISHVVLHSEGIKSKLLSNFSLIFGYNIFRKLFITGACTYASVKFHTLCILGYVDLFKSSLTVLMRLCGRIAAGSLKYKLCSIL